MSTKCLLRKVGVISEDDFKVILESLQEYLASNNK